MNFFIDSTREEEGGYEELKEDRQSVSLYWKLNTDTGRQRERERETEKKTADEHMKRRLQTNI